MHKFASREKTTTTGNDDPAEEPPSKFSLSGDNTCSGIDNKILDEESWQTLQRYCQKWSIKKAHLESIYTRFKCSIARTEHKDFTFKPQYHVSLDFLADEFMATAGDFVAQIFMQTWFLRRKTGLRPPEDRRSVDFARLVIMCCDLARLGDLELLSNLWACVLHRFDCLLPTKTLDLDLQLNTELVREVITIIHTNPSKELNLLVNMLLEHAESDRDHREERRPQRSRRYLSLRQILRFSFQHPPLLLPAVQFQRVLRRKIIGSRYWIHRRQPASDRGVNPRSCLGLHHAYNDLFDRIDSPRDAWVVASGHVLLHALETNASTSEKGGEWDGGLNERYEQLLDNCLRPAWYLREDTTEKATFKVKYSSTSRRARGIPAFASSVAAQAVDAVAKRAAALRSRIDNPIQSPGGVGATEGDGAAESTGTAIRSSGLRRGNNTAEGNCAAPTNPPNLPTDGGFRGSNLEDGENAAPIDGAGNDANQRTHGQEAAPGSNRSQGRTAKGARSPSAGPRAGDDVKGGDTAIEAATRPCAFCLKRSSRFAMCAKCGRRAARALKDARGSRQVRVLIERYGEPFGLEFSDALETEGDAVRRWVQLYDDQTGAHFFYNGHYDCSVWKDAINLPKRELARKGLRCPKGGVGVLGGSSNTAPGRRKSSLSPTVLPYLDRANCSVRPLSAGESSALSRPISRNSPECITIPPRVVVLAERDHRAATEVVLDAHKRLYPPLRLVSQEDLTAAARQNRSGRYTPG